MKIYIELNIIKNTISYPIEIQEPASLSNIESELVSIFRQIYGSISGAHKTQLILTDREGNRILNDIDLRKKIKGSSNFNAVFNC